MTLLDGTLDVYDCEPTSSNGITCLTFKQTIALARQRETPATCVLHVLETRELWVGIGPQIAIVSLMTSPYRPLHVRIPAYVSSVITALCYHGDQVWCLSRKSWEVVEESIIKGAAD